MKKIIALGVLFCTISGIAQQQINSPQSFFPKERTKVLLVGSFHFDYPNLDANVIANKDKIDVLTEPKKQEVIQLVNYIMKFKPTKIAIEATLEWKATNKLTAYKKGDYRNERDERFQIAMRIANEVNLDTLYAIDADSIINEMEKKDSTYTNTLFKDFDFQSADPYSEMYKQWYAYENKLQSKLNLLEYFKHINSKKYHQLDYGAYLVGDFKLDDTRGADVISLWWYNRNLRILRKLQQINANKSDRILIVVGNGHAAVLRQLLASSPEYELIEFNSLK